MTRRRDLDLSRHDHDWVPSAMPGASGPLDVVALDSPTAPYAILGRFPVGFRRAAKGGYRGAEEFVVLTGRVILDDHCFVPSQAVHVGARRLRHRLETPEGARVLAWFSEPPRWLDEPDLDVDPAAPLLSRDLVKLRSGEAWRTPLTWWGSGPAEDWPEGSEGFTERWWAASAADWKRSCAGAPHGGSALPGPGGARKASTGRLVWRGTGPPRMTEI